MRLEELDVADLVMILASDLREELALDGVLVQSMRWLSYRQRGEAEERDAPC